MTLRMLYCTTDNGPKMGRVFWVGKIKKLALHQSFQERDLQSDVQIYTYSSPGFHSIRETNHEVGCIN